MVCLEVVNEEPSIKVSMQLGGWAAENQKTIVHATRDDVKLEDGEAVALWT